jgi:ComF family protein
MSIATSLRTMPARCVRQMVEFVYASRCAACHTACEPSHEFCTECAAGLDELAGKPRCQRCAMPVAHPAARCTYCHDRGMYPFNRVVALGKFAPPLRDMIHRMKYHRHWELAEAMADRMWECRDTRDLLAWSEVLVPVPLHWTRQVERGFDQSEVIARRLGRRAGIKSRLAAVRIRATGTQTGLSSGWKRRDNVRGAFALAHARWIHGRRITVVDDVLTTGATARSLAAALQQAEPAALSLLVLGVADPRRTEFETI